MNDNTIVCPHCQSPEKVVKFGTFEGIQRYWCKRCRKKFTATGALPKMKTPARVIASAMSCYFGGMPLDSIQRHLQQQYDVYLSEPGIYYWVKGLAAGLAASVLTLWLAKRVAAGRILRRR